MPRGPAGDNVFVLMITRSGSPRPTTPTSGAPATSPPAWRLSLAEAVKSTDELLALLGLDPAAVDPSRRAHDDFPLRVPHSFVRRMRRGDPRDPLLLQVLPAGAETRDVPGFTADPLAEGDQTPEPGLVHKSRGRVLLVVTGACAIHCRYCFRRHFPYGEHQGWGDAWRRSLEYVARDPSLVEVILSGGDPLSAGDDRLAALTEAIGEIPHVRRLRIHTRLPIVLPERVDDRLLTWLAASRLDKVVVLHANHAREIDAEVTTAAARLRDAGALVLNQAVLLRGVNDDVGALLELSEALVAAGILPYYLHLLDRVRGAAHFEVGEEEARRLVDELRARASGYLVPRLVRETPGAASKVPMRLLGEI